LDGASSFLSFDYVSSPGFYLQKCLQMPAAHLYFWKNGEVKARALWNLTFQPKRQHADD
jgi:hypothetical protein